MKRNWVIYPYISTWGIYKFCIFYLLPIKMDTQLSTNFVLLIIIFLLIVVLIALTLYFVIAPASSLFTSFNNLSTMSTNTTNLVTCISNNIFTAVTEFCTNSCTGTNTCTSPNCSSFCQSIVPACTSGNPVPCGFTEII